MAASNIIELTDTEFASEVLNSELPVLVDYWVDWCEPCQLMIPILEAVTRQYKGKLKVCKLNFDQNQATAQKYGVKAFPTLMLFKNGNIEATKVSFLTKEQMCAFIEAHI